MKLQALGAAVVVCLVVAASAQASAPTLLGLSQQDRHPSATFAMPGADDGTIYLATAPDRATDGRFLDENVEDIDFLTDDELQAGHWLSSSQLDPGTYYGMVGADDYDCLGEPGCLSGYSNVLTMTVPEPRPTYRRRVKVYRYLGTVDLTLRIRPLGESRRYRVCWTRRKKGRRCVRGTVDGYSWNRSASDTISVRRRGMRRRTRFTWYVHGHKVASKRARIAR
jgi:hypothetical protein